MNNTGDKKILLLVAKTVGGMRVDVQPEPLKL